jgi:hypothetical protein
MNRRLFLLGIFQAFFFSGVVFAETGVSAYRTVIPFSGSIDFRLAHAEVRVGRTDGARTLALDAVRTGRDTVHFKMDIAHAPFPFTDLAAVIEGEARITGHDPQAREFTGEFKSSNILVNYSPLRDANVKFSVRNRKLVVESVTSGGVSGTGEFQLTGKRLMKLNVEVVSSDIEEVMGVVRAIRGGRGQEIPGISGVMKGAFNLSGAWPRPYIQGRLSAFNGAVQSFNYDGIGIDFEGQYPLLNIKEALVTQANGLSFRLGGMFDLSDIAGLTTQVRGLTKSPVTSSNDNRREWVFNRTATADEARTEFKYLLLKNDRGDTDAVLGIQKSIGF